MGKNKISCAEACYAGLGKRFIEGYIVDPLVYGAPVVLLMLWMLGKYPILNEELPFLKALAGQTPLPAGFEMPTVGAFVEKAILMVVGVLYFFVMETFCGSRTLGKMMCSTVVVDRDGNKPSAARILLRTICRFIPFDAFSFLFAGRWEDGVLRGAWHDKLSGTYVVDSYLLKAWKEGRYDGSDKFGAFVQSMMDEAARMNDDTDDSDDSADDSGNGYGNGSGNESGNGSGERRLRVEDLYPSDEPDEQ